MAKFIIGDTVQLKSGGPNMTVEGVDEEGGLNCVWFVNLTDLALRQYFESETVVKVEDQK